MTATAARFVGPRLTLATALLALHALALPVARVHWLADVLASFAPQALVAAAGCALGAIIVRRRRTAAAALVVALTQAAAVGASAGPVAGPRGPAPAPAASVTVLQWNLHSGNERRDAALRWLEARIPDVDVVVLLEVTPAWAKTLAPLVAAYPHTLVEPRSDNFGIAVLSRLPGSVLELVRIGDPGLPSVILDAGASAAHGGLRLVATHPMPPLGGAAHAARDAQITALARVASAPDRALVIAGDLNATPWSPAIVDLRRTARLADAQRGHGYRATWAPGAIPAWLGLPLDQTLVSDWLVVTERAHGPATGSDHLPVITSLEWSARSAPNP